MHRYGVNVLIELIGWSPDKMEEIKNVISKSTRQEINFKTSMDYHSQTALHTAASASVPEILQLLINAGAEINAKDAVGSTPILYSLFANKLENFIFLIHAGAELERLDDDYNSVLIKAMNVYVCSFRNQSPTAYIHKHMIFDLIEHGNVNITEKARKIANQYKEAFGTIIEDECNRRVLLSIKQVHFLSLPNREADKTVFGIDLRRIIASFL